MKAVLIKLLIQIVELVTPDIREVICESLLDLKKKVKKSANPWDDIAVDLLLTVMACDEKE